MTSGKFRELQSFASACLKIHLALAESGGLADVEAYLDEEDLRTVHLYAMDRRGSWVVACFELARPVTHQQFQRRHRDSIERIFRFGRDETAAI
jgi:hypothetical protein